jgi:choline dehydrogenase-like flavoprotein
MAIGAVLAAYRLLGMSEWLTEIIKKDLQPSYDYVIVGGGTSGGVLAYRLSEDANKTILVIEAGGHPNVENVDVPIFADTVRSSGQLDWRYTTVPQKHACKAHVDQVCLWHLGKGLGGSSNINYMLYLRGNRYDYDEWANNLGAQGWMYRDVLPYFIKSED